MAEAASHVLAAVDRRGPTLGPHGLVVAVDGLAGAGKTTLAAALAAAATDDGRRVEVVHMDDLYDGWRGLLTVGARVEGLLRSLHSTGEATYRRYDWHRGGWAEEHRLTVPDLLVLEGVGSSHPSYDHLVGLRVWVEAPRDLRLRRGLARDGEGLRDHWLRFLDDEQVVHTRDRTRERADVTVSGTTGVAVDVSREAPDPRGRR